jgi:hypothetical protein
MFVLDAQQRLCVTPAGEAAQNEAQRSGVGEIGVDFVGGTPQYSGGAVDMKKCAG